MKPNQMLFKTPEHFQDHMTQQKFEAEQKLSELQGILQCPPHKFAWRNDGKAECVKCGQIM